MHLYSSLLPELVPTSPRHSNAPLCASVYLVEGGGGGGLRGSTGAVLMLAAGSTYTTSVERLQGTVQGQGRPGTGTGGGGGAGSDWKAWVCSRTTRVTTAETNTKAAVAMMMRARVGSAKSCRQAREMLVCVGGGGAGGGACQVPQVSGLLPFLAQPLLKRYDPGGTCNSGAIL